jgi:gamma-glutamyl hydrolase
MVLAKSTQVRLGIILMDIDDAHYMETATHTWLTAVGIELVPILSSCTGAEAAAFFDYIHGLYLHPGFAGGSASPAVIRLMNMFMTMATAAHKAGDYFPVWGTCFGMQQMMTFVGGLSGLNSFDSKDYFKQVHGDISLSTKGSRLLKAAPPKFIHDHYLPWFNHQEGLSVSRFVSNPALSKTFRILARAHDRSGKEYVALIEGKDQPWYGCQFHPEYHKPLHEVTWLANFIKSECAKSRHTGFLPKPAPQLYHGMCKGVTRSIVCLRTTKDDTSGRS